MRRLILKTPMVFDSSTQARQLFLAEALELCQQVKEGLLILAHAPTPLTYQKLVRRVQALRQGAQSLELIDIGLFVDGLGALLETCSDSLTPISEVNELLHHLCDGLQLSLITHSSLTEKATASSQRKSVLHSLLPKALEVFEAVLTQTLPVPLQSHLLEQQAKWIQFWGTSLDLDELKTLSEVTLTAFEAFPQATIAIAQVALAGFQIAHETILQRLTTAETSLERSSSSQPQRPLYPSEQALEVFRTKDHLLGLAHQTIFCAATASIEEIALLEPSQLRYEDGQQKVLWREALLPLHQFIDLWQPTRSLAQLSQTPKDSIVLILNHESQTFAIALDVDRLIVETELKLERPEGSFHPCCYGVTTLEEGAKVEVIDVNCLLWEQSINSFLEGQSADEPFSSAQGIKSIKVLSLTPLPVAPLSKTILIVDDSRTVREMLALTLQGAGFSVLQAEDGQQAIEHLKQRATIHLTICDIEMSNLNGFEFLRHRLQDPLWGNIPVLILSSHTDQAYRQLAHKLGAADYFTIPYDETALIQSIEGLLDPKITHSGLQR
jgi:CheY-like chemotaxis protein